MAEYAACRNPDRCPTHPGALLRDDVLPALGVSVTEAARRINAPIRFAPVPRFDVGLDEGLMLDGQGLGAEFANP